MERKATGGKGGSVYLNLPEGEGERERAHGLRGRGNSPARGCPAGDAVAAGESDWLQDLPATHDPTPRTRPIPLAHAPSLSSRPQESHSMALTSAGSGRSSRSAVKRITTRPAAAEWQTCHGCPSFRAAALPSRRVPTRDHAVDVDDAAEVGLVKSLGELRRSLVGGHTGGRVSDAGSARGRMSRRQQPGINGVARPSAAPPLSHLSHPP